MIRQARAPTEFHGRTYSFQGVTLRRIRLASLSVLVAILPSLAFIPSSAAAVTPTTKFLTLACQLNGETILSGWKGNPTDGVIIWADALGTFATADYVGDLPAHPDRVSVHTPPSTVLSDNGQPITQVFAVLDYGTGTYPVLVNATCS